MAFSLSHFYSKGGADDVAVTDGGTAASAAAAARTNLGVTIYDTTTHDAESHENVATVLSPTDHDAVDHTLTPLFLLDGTVHDARDHSGLLGVGTLVDRKRVSRTDKPGTAGFTTGGIPQITTGTELLSLALTPKKAGNTFRMQVHVNVQVDIAQSSRFGVWATGRVIGPDAVGTGFAFTATTITRNDGGDWEADGFRVGDIVTIANAEDVANDGATTAITVITATVITIGAAAFTVNADDTTVTFSPDTNAITAETMFSSVNAMIGPRTIGAHGVFTNLATLTFSFRAGSGGAIGGIGGTFGEAGPCWLEVEEFDA